jgi:cardiolipin synthase
MAWPTITTLIYLVYAVSVTVFLIMDRRNPQSTIAWLLFMLSFPVVSLIIYVLIGRSWKAFSRENYYVRKDIGRHVVAELSRVLPPPRTSLTLLQEKNLPIYNRLLQLGLRNSYAVVTINNHVEILQDAETMYPCLLEDLKAAVHSIHLEFFSWATDEVMDEFDAVLEQKARAGVEVRLLFDAVGSFLLFKRARRNRLRSAGVEVAPSAPVLRIHTISYRNHRKICVIDNLIGYVGGMNMGKEHIEGQGKYNDWRDTHLRIEGEAVRVLQAQFATDWYHATKQSIVEERYFPEVTDRYGETPVQLVSSGPDSRYEAIRQIYFYMITTANSHVYIQSPFFILDPGMTDALQAAALSGVDVRIMLAPYSCGDNALPYWAAYTYMLEMIRAGVRVYLYQGGYMHAKTVSTDGLVCSVGSANMDIRSFNIDYEMNAVLYDSTLAQEIEARFLEDVNQCVLFEPRIYAERPALLRFRDAAARLLSPVL